MKIKEVNEQYRQIHGDRVSLLHFAPLGVMQKDGVKVDFGDAEVRARIVPSLREWVASAPVQVIRGHVSDAPGSVATGRIVDIVLNEEPPAEPGDLALGLFAVTRWTKAGWKRVQDEEIQAVSMRMQLDAPDHEGRIWPAVLRHIAVVDEPLFAAGQQSPTELAASVISTGTASTTRGLALTAALVMEDGMNEETIKQILEALEALAESDRALGERMDKIQAAYEEMRAEKEEEADVAAEDNSDHEDMQASAPAAAPTAPASSAVSPETDARIRQLVAELGRAKASAQDAEAKLARKNAEELIASAVKAGKIDGGRQSALIASAVKDLAGTKAILDAIPARTDFSASTGGVAPTSIASTAGTDVAAVELMCQNQAFQEARKNGWTPVQEADRFAELLAQHGG